MRDKVGFLPEIALTPVQMADLLLEEAQEEETREAKELRKETLEHLDCVVAEFREMKMQPAPSTWLRTSLERVLRHKGLLRA